MYVNRCNVGLKCLFVYLNVFSYYYHFSYICVSENCVAMQLRGCVILSFVRLLQIFHCTYWQKSFKNWLVFSKDMDKS